MRKSDQNSIEGFKDIDSKDMNHDAICIWLYEKLKEDSFAEQFINKDYLKNDRHDIYLQNFGREIDSSDVEDLIISNRGTDRYISIKDAEFLCINKKSSYLEEPLNPISYNDRHKIIGYADLVFRYELKFKTKNGFKQIDNKLIKSEYEFNVFPSPVFFEVKTKINVGETIRQINYYKARIGNDSKWIVVSQDDSYKSLFNEQGIGFLKAKR